MSKKNYDWHKIAESIAEINVSANGMAAVEVAGKKICVVVQDRGITACTNSCPHAGGVLSAGLIDRAGNIVCPLHQYKFNIENGRNTSGEGYYLKTYPVEIREGAVYVGIEENGLFNWLK